MNEGLKVEIQAITIVHIIAIIVGIIFFMIFYIKANKDHALKSFLVLQLSMIGWMVFKVFKTVSPTVMSRWWFIVAYYFCACVLEVSFLEFSYAYYKGKPISRKVRLLAYIFPFLQFVLIATNPYHHLFYQTYDFWGDSFGPLFYIHTLMVYVYIGIGFVYCYQQFRLQFREKNLWYRYLISAAILLPLIFNFLFITKILHKFLRAVGVSVVFDITPIVFTWSVLFFVYATFKADFFSLSPILRHEIVHKLATAICVLDSSYSVIYVNERLDQLLSGQGKEIMTEAIRRSDCKKTGQCEIKVKGYDLLIFTKEVDTFLETQHMLVVKDVTPYREVQEALDQRQKELDSANIDLKKTIEGLKESSKENARGYVARELHDIIGHSLVVTIKLLEVAKTYFKKDDSLSNHALGDAIQSITQGMKNMKDLEEKKNDEETYTGEGFKMELKRMLLEVQRLDIKTKLIMKGALYSIDPRTYDVIRKVCLELITNTIKHSQCNEIFMSITLNNEQIQLLVMDDGNGIKELNKGSGLEGIEERIALIGGKVKFNTSNGEGFMTHIYVPNG